ncbi:Hypothetical Protein sle_01880 [Streptomyces leeuwenhoekii]|uniref:Uncharacterized protein n=1 Tax=Streptomyces leeuwenhoekii TaxID=1437453 RepID=A0A0F7VLJ5_STRLW|nr:Hypothetical Protein sle_01880 [Streptomyces leeuwenhoekii]
MKGALLTPCTRTVSPPGRGHPIGGGRPPPWCGGRVLERSPACWRRNEGSARDRLGAGTEAGNPDRRQAARWDRPRAGAGSRSRRRTGARPARDDPRRCGVQRCLTTIPGGTDRTGRGRGADRQDPDGSNGVGADRAVRRGDDPGRRSGAAGCPISARRAYAHRGVGQEDWSPHSDAPVLRRAGTHHTARRTATHSPATSRRWTSRQGRCRRGAHGEPPCGFHDRGRSAPEPKTFISLLAPGTHGLLCPQRKPPFGSLDFPCRNPRTRRLGAAWTSTTWPGSDGSAPLQSIEVRFGTSRAGAVDIAPYTTASVDAIVPAHPEVDWEQLRAVASQRSSVHFARLPAGERAGPAGAPERVWRLCGDSE